jgi:excisionase family DNA binding protein
VLQGLAGKLVAPRKAAALLGVNRETIYRLCARGELPHVRVGAALRIDLFGYLARRRTSEKQALTNLRCSYVSVYFLRRPTQRCPCMSIAVSLPSRVPSLR